MERSIKLSTDFEFVVACDISEFYPRLGHHRLENALKQIAGDTPYPKRIMQFLSNYSNTRSFGLPIGGPAARILSEITINQIDRLLIGNGITFTRFADDYHLFAKSREDAYPPMPPVVRTKRRAVIAELAFSLFVQHKKNPMVSGALDIRRDVAWSETVRRLAPYAGQGLDIETCLNDEENREMAVIADRLQRFFNSSRSSVLRPTFAGCGYVDASEGDVIFGSTFYEVKTVERPVRSSDIRQTITYAALNAASSQFDLQNVGLFNPRRGQYCDMGIEYVCSEISGRPAQELLAIIIQALSSGEISR